MKHGILNKGTQLIILPRDDGRSAIKCEPGTITTEHMTKKNGQQPFAMEDVEELVRLYPAFFEPSGPLVKMAVAEQRVMAAGVVTEATVSATVSATVAAPLHEPASAPSPAPQEVPTTRPGKSRR